MWVHYLGVVYPDQFRLMHSIWYLGMVIVGGLGSTAGVIFGVVFLRLLELGVTTVVPMMGSAFPSVQFQIAASLGLIVQGGVIIIFLLFEPRGLAHRWEIFKYSYRLWPFPYWR